MKYISLALSVAILLSAGCASQRAESGSPPVREQPTGTESSETPPAIAASMPTLEFIDGSSVSTSSALEGTTLKTGGYDAFLNGTRISEVQWTEDPVTGQPVLTVRLDQEGTTVLERWTREHVNRQLIVAVHGIVVSAPMVMEPIAGGSVQIAGSNGGASRSLLQKAIVVSP